MTSRRNLCRSSQAALLTAAALVAMLAVGCQSAENAPTSPAPAAVSPVTDPGPAAATPGAAAINASKLLDETRLPDLKGAARSLRDRMGPKGLLVVFVDTNCPFSATAIREMSSVASVLAKYEIPSLLLNVGEPQATVERFYGQRQVGLPVIYDTGKTTLKAWAVTSTPTPILIDSAGAVAYRGNAVWADVGAAAEKSLKLPAGSLKFTVKGTGFV
ncbi:MAG: TlpA disulfide reductase family protein [Planctomycetota bacterium]|nr:TlpA disulfide reductase family protein [Planctomycetota bacterium]